jgi:hypothetical protein
MRYIQLLDFLNHYLQKKFDLLELVQCSLIEHRAMQAKATRLESTRGSWGRIADNNFHNNTFVNQYIAKKTSIQHHRTAHLHSYYATTFVTTNLQFPTTYQQVNSGS